MTRASIAIAGSASTGAITITMTMGIMATTMIAAITTATTDARGPRP